MIKRKPFILFTLVFAIVSLFLVGGAMATLIECTEVQDGKKGEWYRICLTKAGEETFCTQDPDGDNPDGPDFACYEWEIEACKLTAQGGVCTDAVPQQLNVPIYDCNPGASIEVYPWMSQSSFHIATGVGPAEDYIKNAEWWQFTFASGTLKYSIFTNSANALNATVDLKLANYWFPQAFAWVTCPTEEGAVVTSSETHTSTDGKSVTCEFNKIEQLTICYDEDGTPYNFYDLKTDYDLECNVIRTSDGETVKGPFIINYFEGKCIFDINNAYPGYSIYDRLGIR